MEFQSFRFNDQTWRGRSSLYNPVTAKNGFLHPKTVYITPKIQKKCFKIDLSSTNIHYPVVIRRFKCFIRFEAIFLMLMIRLMQCHQLKMYFIIDDIQGCLCSERGVNTRCQQNIKCINFCLITNRITWKTYKLH